MTFEELSKSVYEDLNGSISRVETFSDFKYCVSFHCDDWADSNQRRYFQIIFDDVIESECDTGFCGGVSHYNNHVLTWNHNAPHESVYFSASPKNPHEILGRIYESHIRACNHWRQMKDYWTADSSILASGHGLLFHSPTPLANIYCSQLDGLIPYSRVSTHQPRGGYSVFLFDEKFVIAKGVSVLETNSEHGHERATGE